MAQKWRHFIEAGQWKLRPHRFWNSALFFDRLEAKFPDLYHDLHQSRMAFVKGDANYRRLVGDYYYPHTTSFASLASYFPTHVVALRYRLPSPCQQTDRQSPDPLPPYSVLKSEVAVGMAPGQAEAVAKKDAQWLVDGKWATIHHAPGRGQQ